MDCYPNHNTSPFVHSVDCPPRSCPEDKLHSHCYWEESLFDCLHDITSHSPTNSGDFHVNTDVSYVTGDVTTTVENYYEEYHDEGYGGHAALNYDDVEASGPPARPQEFPTPYLHEGVRTTIRAVDHRTQNVRVVKNVLMALSNAHGDSIYRHPSTLDSNVNDKAYLLKKRISRSCEGNRYLSVVLRRRSTNRRSSFDDENEKLPEDDWDSRTVEWESTEEFVIITVSPWNPAMRNHRRSLALNRGGAVHSIAAMQHVGNYHPHVLGVLAVFSDEQHMYTITPYRGGMDLQTKIVRNRQQGQDRPNEPQARIIFTQLLQGLFHLQRKGVCHSNLSLENIFIDGNNQNLVITDLGRSFRVPYNDPSNFGCLTGETEGTTRRLLQLLPQDFGTHPTQNVMFLPPEVVENEDAFDGFAGDLWAAGCILFVLLMGMAPFKTAHYWDAAYAEISSGNLKGLLGSLNIHLSEEATDLLQQMFWRDPRDRLSLAQILDHAWVNNRRFPTPAPVTPPSTLPRKSSCGNLSDAFSGSTTASSETERQARVSLSSGSRKSLSKALTGLFGSSEKRDGGGTGKGWSGMLSSSSNSSHKKRRSSLGGMSSAASNATESSPASPATVKSGPSEELGLHVLQLPSLD